MSDRTAIVEAKRRLPLPTLMGRLGLAEHAKKSARCPFHDDGNNSFSVTDLPVHGWHWKCFASCGSGDEITLLEKARNITRADAIREFLAMAGVQPIEAATVTPQTKPAPFNWQACVDALSPVAEDAMVQARGYSLEFFQWLRDRGLVGLHKGKVAFPVRSGEDVVACHYKDGDAWKYFPAGLGIQPFVIGNVAAADCVMVFESQWDAFAVLDKYPNERDRLAFVVTRGAGNGKLIKGLIPAGKTVFAWKQNDEEKNGRRAGDVWLSDVADAASVPVRWVVTPTPHKDANDWTRAGATAEELFAAMEAAEPVVRKQSEADFMASVPVQPEKRMVEFLTPSQLRDFDPPEGWNIVGDYHIQRTSAFVIGGPPGTGKSRALTFLAMAGATGQPFFGMPVHRQFKTMILQCENGRVRLKNELAALGPEVDEWIRYSPPPPFGFAFTEPQFLKQLREAVEQFRPDVFAIDPWNRLARDDRGKDYKEAFEAILSALPPGDDCPAIGVVAHTRKPQVGERADGRALLNLLAGSYVLGSVPRSAFILQPASDDGTDDRVVWACAKNNDGDLGDRSAWIRRNGLFAPCPDFDWSEFDGAREDMRKTITEEDMGVVFEGGRMSLSRAEATRKLEEKTGFTKTPCYNAMNPKGRFAGRLTEKRGLLQWK